MKKARTSAVTVSILVLIFSFLLTGYCANFEQLILGETNEPILGGICTISPDSKWLVLQYYTFSTEPVFSVIDLETGLKENITYVNCSPLLKKDPVSSYSYTWVSPNNLIIIDSSVEYPFPHYSLGLEKSNTTLKNTLASAYPSLQTQNIFDLKEKRNIFDFSFQGTQGDEQRLSMTHPELRVIRGEKTISLSFVGKEFASYEPLPETTFSEVLEKASKESGGELNATQIAEVQKLLQNMSPEAKKMKMPEQNPYLNILVLTPDYKYILYVISWGAEGSLYCFNTHTREVNKIDENFCIYDPQIFVTTSKDSKKFIYIREYRKKSEGKFQIIELVLE